MSFDLTLSSRFSTVFSHHSIVFWFCVPRPVALFMGLLLFLVWFLHLAFYLRILLTLWHAEFMAVWSEVSSVACTTWVIWKTSRRIVCVVKAKYDTPQYSSLSRYLKSSSSYCKNHLGPGRYIRLWLIKACVTSTVAVAWSFSYSQQKLTRPVWLKTLLFYLNERWVWSTTVRYSFAWRLQRITSIFRKPLVQARNSVTQTWNLRPVSSFALILSLFRTSLHRHIRCLSWISHLNSGDSSVSRGSVPDLIALYTCVQMSKHGLSVQIYLPAMVQGYKSKYWQHSTSPCSDSTRIYSYYWSTHPSDINRGLFWGLQEVLASWESTFGCIWPLQSDLPYMADAVRGFIFIFVCTQIGPSLYIVYSTIASEKRSQGSGSQVFEAMYPRLSLEGSCTIINLTMPSNKNCWTIVYIHFQTKQKYWTVLEMIAFPKKLVFLSWFVYEVLLLSWKDDWLQFTIVQDIFSMMWKAKARRKQKKITTWSHRLRVMVRIHKLLIILPSPSSIIIISFFVFLRTHCSLLIIHLSIFPSTKRTTIVFIFANQLRQTHRKSIV